MADNYDGMAVGVFELDNLVACFVALDAASKAANVKIQSVCLLYTSPSPRDYAASRMPSSA